MRARVDANRQDVDVDRRQVMRDWLKQSPETPWQRRLHGDLTDEKLVERTRKAEEALRTDTVINDPKAMSKARWLNASLHREAARRELLDAELARRGAELSAQQPLWARELGPVTGSPRRAETWRTLAAEIEAFRTN